MQSPSWLPSAVWTDCRVAVLLLLLCPLGLMIWAFVQNSDVIQHLLGIYWRVASLLAITVYLFAGAISVGFLAGWLALILIPLSLWFWADLNEELREQRMTLLKKTFLSWRWAASFYSAIAAIAHIPALQCALMQSKEVVDQPFCRIWLEPAWMFREYFNAGMKPYTLGLLGSLGLGVYLICLAYFAFFRLGKQGRSATGR
jgi:hypothetical protein